MTTAPLLVVIGPSGSGKSSVVRELARRGAVRVHPTWTTRPTRPDEDRAFEHRFVGEAEFDARTALGFFADVVTMFGLPYRYGLPPLDRSTDGSVDVVMLRAPLVRRFKDRFGPCVVFQIEDDERRLTTRLRGRGTSAEDTRARIADNAAEVVAGRAVADRIFVNDSTIDALADTVALSLVPYVGLAAAA